MGVKVVYHIFCDNCFIEESEIDLVNSIDELNETYIKMGGTIHDGKYFCCKECYEEYNK